MSLKKFGLVLAFTVVGIAAGTSCGADPCEELSDICARCSNEGTKSACQATANADGHDACDSAISVYTDGCP
jgi:hypothetical protein